MNNPLYIKFDQMVVYHTDDKIGNLTKSSSFLEVFMGFRTGTINASYKNHGKHKENS